MDQKHWDGEKGCSATSEKVVSYPPPPTYPHSQNQPQFDNQIPHPGPKSVAPAYPPQPHHVQAVSRTLHILYEGSSGVRILDADNITELYRAKMQLRKPHLRIESASTGAIIGTAIYHSLTSRIDTTVHDAPIPLTADGFLGKHGHVYSSPALQSANVRWKIKGSNLDLVCLDERDVAIARIRFNNWSFKLCGKLELLGPTANDGGAVFEEIFITGMAMAQYAMTLKTGGAVSG